MLHNSDFTAIYIFLSDDNRACLVYLQVLYLNKVIYKLPIVFPCEGLIFTAGRKHKMFGGLLVTIVFLCLFEFRRTNKSPVSKGRQDKINEPKY